MNNTLHYIVLQTIYIKFVNPNTCPDVDKSKINGITALHVIEPFPETRY